MSSLYVDRRGVALRLDGEALAFYEDDKRVGTVPIAPLDRVFLRGDIALSASLLGKFGAHGISVVILSGRKGEATLMLTQPHKDAARRVMQYRLSQDMDFRVKFAQCTVEVKLREQLALLDELREKNLHARYELTVRCRQLQNSIDKITGHISLEALRGLEGHAAAAYFAGLVAHLPPGLKFTGRNRRPPRDPINAVLSLGYTLLHADAVVALHGAGLDPYIGFYHDLHFGRESLACDLIEALRPQLDRFVLNLFAKGQIRTEDFSQTEQGCLMGKAGRARFYPLYELAAEGFRKSLTESIRDIIGSLKQYGLPASSGSQDSKAISHFSAEDDIADDAGEERV